MAEFIGKAHVAPFKVMTIPRMELVAATLSKDVSPFEKRIGNSSQ